jgi:hypothetical protein
MFIGLDVHKATISVAVADGKRGGEVRSWGVIPNRADEVKKVADSDDPGRLFQSDPGHHSDLIPAGQKPDRVA